MCFCKKIRVCKLQLSRNNFKECLCACHFEIYEKLVYDQKLISRWEYPSNDTQLLVSLATEKALVQSGQVRQAIILSLDSDDDETETNQRSLMKCKKLFNKYIKLIRLFEKTIPVACEIQKAITDQFKKKDPEIPEPLIGPDFLLWLPYCDGTNHFADVSFLIINLNISNNLAKKQS